MPDARAIVSLVPAGTEIVAALGAWERLVGVSHACDAPAIVTHLPRVTSTRIDTLASPGVVDAAVVSTTATGTSLFALDVERIQALRPDLILTQGLCERCAVSDDDVRAIVGAAHPRPRVESLAARRFDDVLATVTQVAEALGLLEEGLELLAGILYRLRRVHQTLKAARAPRPRVAMVEWTDPLYTAGHWVPDMVHRAGGRDVLALPGEHSRRIQAAEIQSSAPEVVIIAACGYDVDRSASEGRRLLRTAEWAWARALPVWAMDGNALTSRPGPRLCEGIESMARILNPALFSPVGSHHARLLTPE